MIPPLNQNIQPTTGNAGVIDRFFHRWLNSLARSADGAPRLFDEAPGSFLVPSGQHAIFVKQLALAGSERATLQGNARLVGCG